MTTVSDAANKSLLFGFITDLKVKIFMTIFIHNGKFVNNIRRGMHFVSVGPAIEDGTTRLTRVDQSCRNTSVKLSCPTPNANHRSD